MANQPKPPRLPDKIIRELNGTDWRLELATKHWKLMVNGAFIAVLPKGKIADRSYGALKNTVAKIKRAKAIDAVTQ